MAAAEAVAVAEEELLQPLPENLSCVESGGHRLDWSQLLLVATKTRCVAEKATDVT